MRIIGWLGAVLLSVGPASAERPRVVMETGLGPVTIELETERAPATSGDFLRNVDARRYDGGSFYRVVRPDNDPKTPPLSVVQGGAPNPDNNKFPPLKHESTLETGLSHTDGVISVAREAIGSGRAAQFFICVGDNRSLDHGGPKAADGQGFAAFGRVVEGIDVIRRILSSPTDPNPGTGVLKGGPRQMLSPAIPIISVRRNGH